jgi:signal-transduction protein with cAMP-binding, CBS, and nucleotidyltransferase domain
MILKHALLTPEELQTLAGSYNTYTFPQDTVLFYENQIPNSAVIVFDGELSLLRRNRELVTLSSGSALGAQHLLKNKASKVMAKLRKNARVLLLAKSELLKLQENSLSPLYPIVCKLL